jgi:hypothetical protein
MPTERAVVEILVMGYPYWAGVAAGMLGRAGFQARVWSPDPAHVPRAIRWCRPARWLWYLLGGPIRRAGAVHFVGATAPAGLVRACLWLGKRVILHWVGTDALRASEPGTHSARLLGLAGRCVHFADSPEVARELAALGVEAQVFRLLPETVVPPGPVPMPEEPAVLSYWAPGRRAFYGGDLVDALAEALPATRFYVAGSDGAGEPQHPNMTYLGRLDSLEDVYRQVSVLVRMPEHDSLSAMVLEMLARGRWVVYNRPFPHTETATTVEEARAALGRSLARREANEAGREYVRLNFSPQAEAQRIQPLYASILRGLA